MALHTSIQRCRFLTFSVIATAAFGLSSARAQYTYVTDTDNTGNWADNASWTPAGFPNAVDATALINSPIRSGTGTSNYTLALQTNNITVGQIKFDNSSWSNNYNVNITTGGGTLTFQSSTGQAQYIETAGTSTSGSTRITFNPIINVASNWDINDDNVVYLNTGTTFSNLINGDSSKVITKDGHGAIQFNYNLSLLPDEGFNGQFVINQGGIRLIGTSTIAKSTGITVNSGGQLQLADNAATTIPDWSLASGAVLNLNGTGKAVVPNITTADGALRIGITAGRSTTFHNPVVLQTDSHISVAAANTTGTLDNVVSGPGDMIVTGSGKLILTNPGDSYTGDTQVSAGSTLSITNPYLADNADVYLFAANPPTVPTGSTFDLNFAGTDTVRSLFIDGVGQATGTWGAIGSGAANESPLFTGTGFLNVTTQPVVGVPGDFNNDGVVDAADYVLWRKGGALANEVSTPGVTDAQDYLDWRARFGNTSGSGSSLHGASVPEPATFVLLFLVAPFFAGRKLGRNRS